MSAHASSSTELRAIRDGLVKSLSAASPSSAAALETTRKQLTHAKIALTQRGLLVPSPADADLHEVAVARDILEVGAFWSVRARQVDSFDRYIGLLQVFYDDFAGKLPASSNQEPLLGLQLLRLLSSNQITAFHTTLETLPPALIANSPFVRHPVDLERWLMEGSYSKVWRARSQAPREEYRYFVEELMTTIRREIASCEEKAYDSLPLSDAATLLFFDNVQDVSKFANERGWQINPTTQTVAFTNKHAGAGVGAAAAAGAGARAEAMPRKATITSNLQFAKELETIV